MINTPKSLRLQLGIFGRTNVGKSSFLNMIAGQDVAITSPVPGTTTDVVEKVMELLPIGPVVFLDTAGIDDNSELGSRRVGRTKKVFDRADVAVIICESETWGKYEDEIILQAQARKIPCIAVLNKADIKPPSQGYLKQLDDRNIKYMACSSVDGISREHNVNAFKKLLIELCPEDFFTNTPFIGDIMPQGGMAVLIIPIDSQAPKGRIILPQVQTIRDALDNGSMSLVVRESEYLQSLAALKNPPDIVVCDSQVVHRMVAETPPGVKCTTFSILLARIKGNLEEMAANAALIGKLKPGDKVLIAESCSHHPLQDDIGRLKIPRWLKKYVGGEVSIDVCCGRDFPDNLSDYKLIIHCGSCMLTRRDMLVRIQRAREAGVGITNYGLTISYLQGVLERVLTPFPSALAAFLKVKDSH